MTQRISLRVIFCSAVSLAVLAVILLAVFSPIPHRTPSNNHSSPLLSFSLYIQQSHESSSNNVQQTRRNDDGAFTFHRTLTEGPQNTSRVVGRAQGFIIAAENFADSAFNIIYLTYDTPEYSGSLSIQAKNTGHDSEDELTVVGGTGSFAFASGVAVFARTDGKPVNTDGTYHVKLKLRFPNRSQTIPR